MNNEELKQLQKIQSRNVRHLKKVEKNLTMDINNSLLKGDSFKVSLKTKFYSLLYSALSEAQFVQILYTPFGFQESEINKIKREGSIFKQWELMIDISLGKVGDFKKNQDLKKRRAFLKNIIKEFIEKPQLVRNKIAHGQWLHALNSPMTDENTDTSRSISALNVVEISKWFEIHQYLCFIVRDLIQSPQKAFHSNYWVNYTKLEQFVERSKSWTMEERLKDIKRKYENRKS